MKMRYLCLLHMVSVGGGSTVIYILLVSGIKIVFQSILLQLKDDKGTNQPIKVKISGDGARMSHTINHFAPLHTLHLDNTGQEKIKEWLLREVSKMALLK